MNTTDDYYDIIENLTYWGHILNDIHSNMTDKEYEHIYHMFNMAHERLMQYQMKENAR